MVYRALASTAEAAGGVDGVAAGVDGAGVGVVVGVEPPQETKNSPIVRTVTSITNLRIYSLLTILNHIRVIKVNHQLL